MLAVAFAALGVFVAAALGTRACTVQMPPDEDGPPATTAVSTGRPASVPRNRPEAPLADASTPTPEPETWVVRDLATGEPVPHFAFRVLNPDAADKTWYAGDDGKVALEGAESTRLASVSEAHWCAPRVVRSAESGEYTLWTAEWIEVVGSVVDGDGRRITGAAVSNATAGSLVVGDPSRPFGWVEERSESWWRRMLPEARTVAVGSDGSFRLRTLDAPELGIYVTGVRGHCSGVVRLDGAMRAERTRYIDVVCLPVRGFRVRVSEADGTPVEGARVQVTTALTVSRDEAAAVVYQRPEGGHGYTADGATVWFTRDFAGRTGVSGTADIAVSETHRAVIHVYDEGRGLVAVDVPASEGDVIRDIVLPPRRTPSPVRIELDGKPLRDSAVLVSDLRGDPIQVTFPRMRTDAEGMLDTGYLDRDIPYAILAIEEPGLPRLRFTWRGHESLELESR